MPARPLAVLLLLAGCVEGGQLSPTHRPTTGPGETEATDTATGTTDTDTDTVVPPRSLEAECLPDPTHALRQICNLTVTPASPVEVAFTKSDGTGVERVHTSVTSAEEHVVWLYLMEADTDYAWTARVSDALPEDAEVEGVFTSGPLPSGAVVRAQVSGSSSAPMFLVNSPCSEGGYALIIDPQGTVLWYHDFAQPSGPSIVDVVNFTEDGTVSAMIDDHVIEVDLLGQEVFHTERNVDYFVNVHHDMVRSNGITYILYNENVSFDGDDYIMDGLLVFDANENLLHDWHLIDHFQPTRPAVGAFGAEDYSHANAVWVDVDGNLLLSMRHLSAVAKIKGDPYAPDFGEILWRISGDPTEQDFGMDFTLTSTADGPPDFRQQHNVHRRADGRYTLFDNRMTALEHSRVLVMSIDEQAMTLNIDESYELPVHCAFQGGAWHTDVGNPVGTCAPSGTAFEFTAGVYDQASLELELDCVAGFDNYIPRFMPLDL